MGRDTLRDTGKRTALALGFVVLLASFFAVTQGRSCHCNVHLKTGFVCAERAH